MPLIRVCLHIANWKPVPTSSRCHEQIRHGVRGQQVAKQGVNTGPNALSGKLVSPNNPTQAIMSWPNNDSPYPGQSSADRIGDIIPLSTILDAVGLDLDAVYLNNKGQPSTARYDGINLVVSVNYEMVGIPGQTLQCEMPFLHSLSPNLGTPSSSHLITLYNVI